MIKQLGFFIMLALGLLVGILVTREYYTQTEIHVDEQSQVLLERIKKVSKLITVEGHFSEIYAHKQYLGWDLPGLRKSALVRVKAQVSVGYNLEKMKISMHPERREIIISSLPDPEVLSIDHQLDYYDISEGAFFPFTETDHNTIQKRAKDLIRKRAEESGLFDEARTQGQELVRTIEFLSESMGWKARYKEGIRIVDLDPDSLLAN